MISFEVATNGQLGVNTQQIKMVITSQGFVGLGVSAPSAQLHTTATVRFQNLPSGTGNYLLIDGNGNVYRSSQAPTSSIGVNDNFVNLQKEIEDLRKLVTELQNEIKKNYTSKN